MLAPRRLLAASLHRLPYPALLRLYYAHYHVFHERPKRRAQTRSGLRPVTASALQGLKTSDTVFILGSGSSINAITEERWEAIRRCDSFGFNFWLLHRHVPTFYTTEAPSFADAEVGEALARAMVKREQDYRNVFLLLTDLTPDRTPFLELVPSGLRRNLHAMQTVPAFARSRVELEANVRLLEDRGLFAAGRADRLFKYRATVSMLVSLAVKMGYRKIVLCGIDLSNPVYFYQDAERYPETATFQSSVRVAEPVHTTLIERPLLRPIDEVLVVLKDLVLDPLGVELYVESASSALFPRIPLAPEGLFLP
jgi:hypothetical protein